ncbi:DNA gyrase subunit A [Alkalibacter saccharofermentans]|uniref:DNA gyrase subunit A n=1 Tax=Alkalibacter saccharofermentans DSM 14828 TaxID=1120975 RepID=A0A1M4T6L9_9FIRM|nr:DNA gyrase subunit A [Alkalibacter saccharofermentans]SHE40182.1 DNA gyrase subunit A [Alkalibacter saccharofermentans DSM 14828]
MSDEYNKVLPINIEDEMKKSYIDYAMSVIVGRALPDVRDGLKPVHRRILFAMNELGMTPEKPFRKSARIVGDVLGKYHPHGDTAVYDAMVRMAQEFSTRYPLVFGHGNFGSIDGDSAAAMRYTEAKMSKISTELLRDINKDTVDFTLNFDETQKEPVVMPSRYPNLLVNGSSGIAVGMATNIPPHNLNEVIDATVHQIDNPECHIEELMKLLKGPDFPTGGIILGKEGIRSAYETGRGRIKVRAKVHTEEISSSKQRIVITEIPYMVNKSKLVEKIADLVKDKKVEGISDIRDESDRNGIRVAIDLKRDVNSEIILNQLYKHTQLQETFGVILLALDKNQPKIMNLKEILTKYVEHQKEIIIRRTQFDLKKAEDRAHILEGLIIALDNIDRVIQIIRGSKNGEEAKISLIEEFALSEKQAQAILDMRLQRLTGLEREKIETEYDELMIKIAEFKRILSSEELILNVIKEEMLEIKEKFGDDRRTAFEVDYDDISMEDLIEEEDLVITMTHVGYVKRISADTYTAQKRGGKGITALSTRDNDFVEHLFTTTTHHYILFFTNRGKVYRLKAYEIPDASRTARGTAIVNILQLEDDEKVTTVIPIREFSENWYLTMATRKGIIKKTDLKEYDSSRKSGLLAINLNEDDELIAVELTDGSKEMIMGTKKGYAIRFSENDVRAVGRTAIGVRGIFLRDDDEVIGMDLINDEMFVLTVSENGYGKVTKADEYRIQNRGGKGIQTYKITSKTGDLVGIKVCRKDEEVMMINNQGIVIRLEVGGISIMGRSTQGVRLMKLDKSEKIVTIAEVISEEEIEEIEI